MECLVKMVAAILLPPLGVALHEGPNLHFVLNVGLTFAGYLPGLVHAAWRIHRGGQE